MRFASRGPSWMHWRRLGLGRRRLMTRQAKVTDRVGGLVTQLYNLDHHYRLTITVWQTTSKILCLLNQLESSDKGSEYYVSKLWRFHKIVTGLKLKIPIASVIVTCWLKPTHTTLAIWELRSLTEIHDSFPKKAQRTFTYEYRSLGSKINLDGKLVKHFISQHHITQGSVSVR